MRARPLFLGHRGARGNRSIPENTIASFERALSDGCEGFEFDVRLTHDGEAVVCHDPVVRGVEVARASRKELKDLPVLQDVLAQFCSRAFLDIELKVPGLERITAHALSQQRPLCGLVVSSFHPEILTELHAVDASLPLGFIFDRQSGLSYWTDLPIQFVAPQYRLVTRELVQDIHRTNREVLVWTVNDEKSMFRMADCGVDGLISDETRLLVRTLQQNRR